MLYEQLNAIKKELGIQKDDKSALLEKFKTRLADVTLEPAVKVRMRMIVLRRVMRMIAGADADADADDVNTASH